MKLKSWLGFIIKIIYSLKQVIERKQTLLPITNENQTKSFEKQLHKKIQSVVRKMSDS